MKYEKTLNCVQCGYCLPVCPTYVTISKETHSPRGRINLVKMVGEGRITDLSVLEEPMNLCLACRACETACPTGVEYGQILEAARAVLAKTRKDSFSTKILKNTLLKRVIPSHNIMNQIGNALWIYEKSGLQKMIRKSGILKKLPAHLGTFESIIPSAVSPRERAKLPKRVKVKGTFDNERDRTPKHNSEESLKL
ncbi:(Fe-S)-binding protein [Heyndrickxia acidicola]|uniref:(Fe-S)-binding protein n=1 Tax=Heyndrickxia acidicola TaxID=209389 RepID=UPI002E236D50